MFGRLRDPRGGFPLAMSGTALLVLAGLAAALPLPRGAGLVLALVLGALALACLGAALRRSREDPYDLKRLWDAPPPEVEEPLEDVIPHDEDSSPYCGWCDEAHPPGTYRCRRCGREMS